MTNRLSKTVRAISENRLKAKEKKDYEKKRSGQRSALLARRLEDKLGKKTRLAKQQKARMKMRKEHAIMLADKHREEEEAYRNKALANTAIKEIKEMFNSSNQKMDIEVFNNVMDTKYPDLDLTRIPQIQLDEIEGVEMLDSSFYVVDEIDEGFIDEDVEEYYNEEEEGIVEDEDKKL